MRDELYGIMLKNINKQTECAKERARTYTHMNQQHERALTFINKRFATKTKLTQNKYMNANTQHTHNQNTLIDAVVFQ